MKISKKEIVLLCLILLLFFLPRLLGMSLPYHQDETKNANAVARGAEVSGQFFAHPPLTALLLRFGNFMVGNSHLRLFTLLFALLGAVLFFFIMRRRAGTRAAFFSLGLFSVCFYEFIAALMVDTDGAILVFFFLLSLFAYDRYNGSLGKNKKFWLAFLLISLLLGLFVKLSFVIAIGALLVDFILQKRALLDKKTALRGAGLLVSAAVVLVAIFSSLHFIYPAFSFARMIDHARYYMNFSGRNYLQVIVESMKAIFYLSPLLILPLLFLSKAVFRKARIFFLYLGLGFIFYFVLFDFSKGALDKYLTFTIIPLSAIVGMIFAEVFEGKTFAQKEKTAALIGAALSFFLFSLNFVNQAVLPLYPKTEWFARALHGRWNMLNPFNGGSGPLGFYVSFLFIFCSFAAAVLVGIFGLLKHSWRSAALIAILLIGIGYNAVFAEELIAGKINGSAPKVMKEAVAYISNAPEISGVLTYNDIGAYELNKIGKYDGRFYAAPQFEAGHELLFADYIAKRGGYFLVVDIPLINEDSFYVRFFSKCKKVFETRDGKVPGSVFYCTPSGERS